MFGDQADRPPPTGLRGWLSDVYFPALLDGALGPLAARLGSRATLDDPLEGRVVGLPAIEAQLKRSAEWLSKLGAAYERGQFTTGSDRDVTEGILTASRGSGVVEVPVAVVAERRRSREVELRVYYPTRLLAEKHVLRPGLVPHNPDLVPPALVGDVLDALRRGDTAAALACFEENGVVRDSQGHAYGRANHTLGAYFERVAPWDVHRCGYAEDGRTCALEYTLVRRGGKEMSPQAGLAVFERGDSGLFRALRVYDDLTPLAS